MTTQKMATLLLFLMVVIVVPVLGRCPPPANETAYQKFLRQHYNNCGMGTKDCPSVMSERCMGKPCKEKTASSSIPRQNRCKMSVAKGACRLSGNLRQSTSPFQVLTCKNKGSESPPCKFKGVKSSRYIVIGCNDENYPVHFDESIIP